MTTLHGNNFIAGRLVAVPDALLPPSLQNANPLGLDRLIDRVRSRTRVA